MPETVMQVDEDFLYSTNFLPAGWHSKAKGLRALRRCKKAPNAQTLLRVHLILKDMVSY